MNPSDFMNDHKVMVMNSEQVGVYFKLICVCWLADRPGCLPADDQSLMRLAMATPEEWERSREAVSRCFEKRHGYWIQKRVRREYDFQSRRISEKSEKNRLNATSRWTRKSDTGAVQSQSLLHSYTPSLLPPKKNLRKNTCSNRSALRANAPGFSEWYNAYPRHVARKAAEKAYSKALLEIDEDTLLKGARSYADSIHDVEPRFVKAPATWLNGGCWADETPNPNGGDDMANMKAILARLEAADEPR